MQHENTQGERQKYCEIENKVIKKPVSPRNNKSDGYGLFFKKKTLNFTPENSERAVFMRLLLSLIKIPGKVFRGLTTERITKFLILLTKGDISQIQKKIQKTIISPVLPPTLDVVPPQIISSNITEINKKGAEYYAVLNMTKWENPKVSIIISVCNQFEFTYHCIKSIIRNSGEVTYEIIIADNRSTDLTTQIEQIIPGIVFISNEKEDTALCNYNFAATYAKGEYILFLDNDTQVQKNWLKPLITLIESAEDIGMVGSKLIFSDGHLKEAGGILWKDGTTSSYGNGQNAMLPQFNYVRETDYLSCASIMLSRVLWEEIGGFDKKFTDASYRACDLALAVWSKNLRVMYQPLSVIVHFGIASKEKEIPCDQHHDVAAFMKKWDQVFVKQSERDLNLFQARDRSYSRKTLLMVDYSVPNYDKDAGSRTVFQYLKLFVRLGFNVKFIGDTFLQNEPYTQILQQMGIEVLYGSWYAEHWKDWIRENSDQIDYAFLNRPYVAPRYMKTLRKYTKAKIIYYGHDLAFLRARREYEITGDISYLKEAKNWKSKELVLIGNADMAYYPSCVEVDEIQKIAPNIHVKTIPAYLFEDVRWEGYDFDSRKDIMFIGGFNHRPNVDAVKWVAEEVLPELLLYLPDIKIHILGSNAPEEVLNLANEHLIMDGFVSDEKLVDFYRNSRISLVPLRYGAGIKGKVIEAMRYGTPVVTTSIGAEGIPNAEKVFIIEDTAECLAKKIASIYNNPELLIQMSQNSIAYIQKNYSEKNAIEAIGPDFNLN